MIEIFKCVQQSWPGPETYRWVSTDCHVINSSILVLHFPHIQLYAQLNRLSQLPLPSKSLILCKSSPVREFQICSCSVLELTSPSLAMTSTSLTPDNKTDLQLADKRERERLWNTNACSVCSLQEWTSSRCNVT